MLTSPRPVAAVLALLAGSLASGRALAAPSVWAIDDGEKIRKDATSTPFERGEQNPVWAPGLPVRLRAMRNETIAFQVVVEADDDALEQVEVDLDALDGPGPAQLGASQQPERHRGKRAAPAGTIERFVEHFVTVERASSDAARDGRSAGWAAGAGPVHEGLLGAIPDALVPVASAPPWAPYPMHVSPHTNGIVWIDVEIPREQAAGLYHGVVEVHSAEKKVASLALEIDVAPEVLPDRTVVAVAGYDRETVTSRAGHRSEVALWHLLRMHRVAPLHDVQDERDLRRQASALDGTLYTRPYGYAGPNPGMGDGEVAIGAHGAFGGPDVAATKAVVDLATRLAAGHAFGGADVFVWAADEKCTSPWAREWSKALRESDEAAAHRVKVGWTCSQDASAQPVDFPMRRASWDPVDARRALADGKVPWVYGGALPRTGTFLLDAPATSPRVNGWIQQMLGIPRWLVPEVARWSRDEDTPIDPYEEPETLRGADGWANGEGLLVYPGSQRDAYPERSADVDGVFPSIRLKNWRRGLEDAGYLQLARERDPSRADEVARWLVPSAMGAARADAPASWGDRGEAFAQARTALYDIIAGRPSSLPARAPIAVPADADAPSREPASLASLVAVCALLGAGAAAFARRGGRAARRDSAPLTLAR